MDLVIRSFSYERQPRIINYSPDRPRPRRRAPRRTSARRSAILGGFTEPSDPNIQGPVHLASTSSAASARSLPNVAVGVKGIYRDYGKVIEDFLCTDDGTYCIGNPGKGDHDSSVFTARLLARRSSRRREPKRIYKGVQLDVTKRFSNNWQALASYIYSKLEGNYDGEYSPVHQRRRRPEHLGRLRLLRLLHRRPATSTTITNRGPLSNDRRHQFKVSGVYITPFKLSVGLSAYYRTARRSPATATRTPTAATSSS